MDQISSRAQRQPTDFMVKREVLAQNATEDELRDCILKWIRTINQRREIQAVCTMKVFDVHFAQKHHIYSPLYLAEDLKDFLVNLYENEVDEMDEMQINTKYGDKSQRNGAGTAKGSRK